MYTYQDLFKIDHLFDRSLKYDFYRYSQHEEVKSISEEIISKIKQQEEYQNFIPKLKYKTHEYIKNLVCNFFIAFRSYTCVAIPRKKSYYSEKSNFGARLISYKVFIFCVDYLVTNSYIEQKKGYKAFGSNKKSKTSKYWATAKLYSQFKTLKHEDIFTAKSDEIILKDADKQIISFKETLFTEKLRSKIQKINDLYEKFDFRTVRETERTTTRLFPRLSAIFNGNFNFGGRLYCKQYRGISYQTLSKNERKKILINGNETVQLDFSGLHIEMIYAIQGIKLQKYPYLFDEKEIAKKTILYLLNAPTERKALYALNQYFKNTIDFRPIIKKAKQFHSPIKKYFGSGIGLKLQNLDSKIALKIVDYFTKKCVPCLPVHDSFIIEKYHQDELKFIMQKTFFEMFHRDITVH